MTMEGEKTVADEIHRRFVTGPEQQDDVGRQFLVGKLVAVFFRLNQMRGQIAGITPSLLE